jgi:small multidrug resistance pump
MPVYALLFVAIVFETIATSALKASDGFTRLGPSALSIACYGLSFYLLSLTLRTIPVGIAYAIWAGLGIVLIAAFGMVLFGQRLDLPAVLGMALIIAGILVIHLFSSTAPH